MGVEAPWRRVAKEAWEREREQRCQADLETLRAWLLEQTGIALPLEATATIPGSGVVQLEPGTYLGVAHEGWDPPTIIYVADCVKCGRRLWSRAVYDLAGLYCSFLETDEQRARCCAVTA